MFSSISLELLHFGGLLAQPSKVQSPHNSKRLFKAILDRLSGSLMSLLGFLQSLIPRLTRCVKIYLFSSLVMSDHWAPNTFIESRRISTYLEILSRQADIMLNHPMHAYGVQIKFPVILLMQQLSEP
jgi:hypothetical protein